MTEIKQYLLSKSFVAEDQLHQMSKENEPTITLRLGSSAPPVSHHHYSDRRGSLPSNLFRHNGGTRTSRRYQPRSGAPATSV